MPKLVLSDFSAVTFDVYGTLIDWEPSIITFLSDWAGPRLDREGPVMLIAQISDPHVLAPGKLFHAPEKAALPGAGPNWNRIDTAASLPLISSQRLCSSMRPTQVPSVTASGEPRQRPRAASREKQDGRADRAGSSGDQADMVDNIYYEFIWFLRQSCVSCQPCGYPTY